MTKTLPSNGLALQSAARLRWTGVADAQLGEADKAKLGSSYAHARDAAAQAVVSGEVRGLDASFVGEALRAARASADESSSLTSCNFDLDLEHRLALRFVSVEGGIVSFLDRATVLRVSRDRVTGRDRFLAEFSQVLEVNMRRTGTEWRTENVRRVTETQDPPAPGGPIAAFDMSDAAGFRTGSSQPRALRGFNYYPREAPWAAFANSYPPEPVERDLREIAKTGANVVRVFVGFGREESTGELVARQNMARLLQVAGSLQLRVVITLFDLSAEYTVSEWRDADRYVERWMTAFADSPVLLAWDLKNEPDTDWAAHGQDQVDGFLTFVALRSRLYDPHHLITIGWHSANVACRLFSIVDFVSIHDYEDPDALGARVAEVARRCGIKGVVLEEFGHASNEYAPWAQSYYFEHAADSLKNAGSTGYIVWTWTDFDGVPAVFGADPDAAAREMHFGMVGLDTHPKAVLPIVQARIFAQPGPR